MAKKLLNQLAHVVLKRACVTWDSYLLSLWWVLGGRGDSFTGPFATRRHGSTREVFHEAMFISARKSFSRGTIASIQMQRLPVSPKGRASIQPVCSGHGVQRGVGVHQVELCPKCLVRVSPQSLVSISTPAWEASLRSGHDGRMRSQVGLT